MNEIWYYYDTDIKTWIKLRWSAEESALSDVFFFMEDMVGEWDFEGKKVPYRHSKGMRLTMDYGCSDKLIDKGELLSEGQYNKKFK